MSEIIPAILVPDIETLRQQASLLPSDIYIFHMDVLEEDIWVDGITKDFEVHIMNHDPERIIERWVDRGAKRVISHKVGHEFARFRDKAELGLGVEIQTPLDQVFPFVDYIDFLHLMSIEKIGAQGHPLDERIFDRIREVKKQFPELKVSVDGGININNYLKLEEAGADRLIVGSGFKTLWESLKKE